MSTTILPSQFEMTDYRRQNITITANSEHDPELYLEPKSYATIAQKIRPHDSITIISEDTAWKMELFVVNAGRDWVRVIRESFTDINKEINGDSPIEENEAYAVEFRGRAKWCVIRKEDNSKVITGEETQEDALRAKRDYEKALDL